MSHRTGQCAILTAPDLTLLAEDYGTFADGYCDEKTRRVLPRWSEALGLTLVCVWDVEDSAGFGGGSECLVVRRSAAGRREFFELPDGLAAFLAGEHAEVAEATWDAARDLVVARVVQGILRTAATPTRRVPMRRRWRADDGVNLA